MYFLFYCFIFFIIFFLLLGMLTSESKGLEHYFKTFIHCYRKYLQMIHFTLSTALLHPANFAILHLHTASNHFLIFHECYYIIICPLSLINNSLCLQYPVIQYNYYFNNSLIPYTCILSKNFFGVHTSEQNIYHMSNYFALY